ncbi:hypothetical protein [Flavobacterium sp.]|uniref:hypothetical protein n=1 Tax=Flavobacterium sp. TaxID=239 RepID=UPI00286BB5E7|nr:hypothetical protein [Flavobacterium sp.]
MITIPNPCTENWNKMSKTEKGRFCNSCNKLVIDFSKMKNKIIFLLLFLITTFTIAQNNSENNAVKLSIIDVNAIANSLVQQKMLTIFGKEELIRYATNQPLLIYKNYNQKQLDSINCSQYIIEEYFDILPGRENQNKKYLGLMQDQGKNDDKILLCEERKFLNNNFPTRTHLIDFLFTSISFHLDDGHQDYESRTTKLAKSFGNYFEPNINKDFLISAIEFSVSYDKDTKILQEERVKVAKPFLKWISIFKTAGLLKKDDFRIENRYANGENIISSIDNHVVVKEVKELIYHQDLFPFFKQKQIEVLDKLVETKFLNNEKKELIVSNYKENELLDIENIVAGTNRSFSLNRKLEIAKFSLMTWNNYGAMEPSSIKKVYELVLQKASKLLNFTYSNLEVHRITTKDYKQLIVLPNNRQYFVLVKINNVLYKESIKEVEGHDWIRASNFQFLNHYLEDQNDDRRFFVSTRKRVTGYEPQESENIYFTLLKQNEETILRNKYAFCDLNVCYAGEPGDYNYDVSYEFYADDNNPYLRLNRNSILEFLKLGKELKLSKIFNHDINYVYAFFRELNPGTINSLFDFLPETFQIDKNQTANDFLDQLETQLQEVKPQKPKYFTNVLQEYKLDKSKNEEKLFISFKFKNIKYEFSVNNEDEVWSSNILLNTVNKAFAKALLGKSVYLFENQNQFSSAVNAVILNANQKAMLDKLYPKLFAEVKI